MLCLGGEKAWKQVQTISSAYAEIRSAQKVLPTAVLDEGQGFIIATVGHIRNSLELSGYWVLKRSSNTDLSAAHDPLAAVQNFDAWIGGGSDPRFAYTTGTYSGSQQWEYLAWLATEATPWVPAVEVLTAAFDAANTAVSRVDYRSFKNQEEARDENFHIIGEKPILAYTSSSASASVPARKLKRPSFGQSAARAMGR
ncbi:hypothetical protein [Paenarthrobacter sp. NPDC089316]|uniref:hypothetical protein n=1 Tax=unclassified Paenarthrobacter TaxID=2634190 RepID=UPI0034435FD8